MPVEVGEEAASTGERESPQRLMSYWRACPRNGQAGIGTDASVSRRTPITVAIMRAAGTLRAAPTLLPSNSPIVLKLVVQVVPDSLKASMAALRVAAVWQA
jgi:hypothetical protein